MLSLVFAACSPAIGPEDAATTDVPALDATTDAPATADAAPTRDAVDVPSHTDAAAPTDVARTDAAPAAPAFIVGVCTHPASASEADNQRLLVSSGARSFRIDYEWNAIELTAGVYTYTDSLIQRTEQLIEYLAPRGVAPLLVLAYGNSHVYGDISTTAARVGFANWAGAVATRHRGRGMLYDVWNEWNGGLGLACHYGEAPCNDGANYTDLLCRAYHAIKAADPDARVLGGVTSGIDPSFVRSMLAAGAAECMDGLSIHPYAGLTASPPWTYTPALAQASVRRLNNLDATVIAAVGHSIPMYATEDGLPSASSFMNTPADQAAYLTEMYTALRALPFMRGLWWYDLVSDARTPPSALEDNYGLVEHDLTAKPAFTAFQAAARMP